VVFLGDYIYETNPSDADVRRHLNDRPTNLDGYRVRYATYKSDPHLQAAHQAAPWISTWDDHEVSDNYANNLNSQNDDPATFLRLRAAAYQAYYEHMPLPRSARPVGPAMRLYRAIDWGGLAQFQLIDDRQYRDAPACQGPGTVAQHLNTTWLTTGCAEQQDSRRTILGTLQEQWLDEQLTATRARWNLLAQQTLMLPYRRFPTEVILARPMLYDLDTWAGYPAARERIARRWRDARTPNPLILSGDIHAFAAGDHVDPDNPSRVLASEFVGGSITSLNHDSDFKEAAAMTPGFRFADNEAHGYGRIDLTPARCEIVFRAIADISDPNSSVRDLARFVIENGRTGLQRA
jgi:alkaline phosphatase D